MSWYQHFLYSSYTNWLYLIGLFLHPKFAIPFGQLMSKIVPLSFSSQEELFVVAISFCIHFVFQALYFLIYAPGYSNLIKAYDEYRINKGVVRPWEGDQKSWSKTRNRLFYYLGINYLVIYPAMIVLSVKVSGVNVRF